MTTTCRKVANLLVSLGLTMLAGGAVHADTLVSPVPVALQEARRHMFDATVNTLTFRSMDQLFFTREVSRSGPIWQLPRRDADLRFQYAMGGQTLTAEQFLDRTYTNALLILKHGRVVYENYRNLSDDHTRFISFSMAKSITSMLIGIAVSEGHIRSLDDPIDSYIPELKGSGYEGVPIRQIMRMRSGVAYDERYDFGVHSQAQQVFEESIVQNVKRFADLAPSLRRTVASGERFNYSTMDTAVLGWMLERAVKQPISSYMTEKLWEPAGMESDGFWIADGAPGVGRALSGMGYNAVARDYARIGQLMLQKGRVGAKQIVPSDWVDLSTASTAIEMPGGAPKPPIALGYGYQWWTLHGTGSYTALGLQGQFIYVDPATETVVVKLSYFPPGKDTELIGESLAFFRAASAWNP